jgi:hypothetical protein
VPGRWHINLNAGQAANVARLLLEKSERRKDRPLLRRLDRAICEERVILDSGIHQEPLHQTRRQRRLRAKDRSDVLDKPMEALNPGDHRLLAGRIQVGHIEEGRCQVRIRQHLADDAACGGPVTADHRRHHLSRNIQDAQVCLHSLHCDLRDVEIP